MEWRSSSVVVSGLISSPSSSSASCSSSSSSSSFASCVDKKKNNNSKMYSNSSSSSCSNFHHHHHNNKWIYYTYLVVVFIVLVDSLVIMVHGAPSSPWNQAGLNLIFKPDLNSQSESSSSRRDHHHQQPQHQQLRQQQHPYESTNYHHVDVNGDSTSIVAVDPLDDPDLHKHKPHKSHKSRPSHTWGYSKFGDAPRPHIRHMHHNNNKNLPSNKSVPCPRDFMRTVTGKCRRIQRFSSFRG